MLQEALLAGLNHLLDGEEWARPRLMPFCGQTVRLELPLLHCFFEISAEGVFRRKVDDTPATVTLSLPGLSPLQLLGAVDNPAALLASAQITGSAGLADCIGFVFRHLRWDVEGDLSKVVGDIAAHRLVRTGKQLANWQRQATRNAALNAVEYFTEERPAIAAHRDIDRFCREVGELAGTLSRIEQRIATLENSRRPQSGR